MDVGYVSNGSRHMTLQYMMIDHTLPGAGSYMISFHLDLILSESVNGLCDEAVMKR